MNAYGGYISLCISRYKLKPDTIKVLFIFFIFKPRYQAIHKKRKAKKYWGSAIIFAELIGAGI